MLVSILKGATFSEICDMTDIFEGSIIRAARRLDEFLNQVCICNCRRFFLLKSAIRRPCSGSVLHRR